MKISKKDWQNYIDRLRRINEKAAGKVAVFMEKHDCSTPEGMKLLIDYAHAVATKYGEGAAELSCQMLDAVADASNAYVPAAEPAVTATYGEIARAVYGTMARTRNPQAVGAAVGRSVKLASLDTLQQNALRNGAEWAWIPSGDTCAYCLMLASRGWVKASAKAIKNGHAEHIHNNCDCTYCVRFDKKTTVEGYDPDTLYDQYISAGDTPSERLNALRRQHYAANKDYINAQKRAAYARRQLSNHRAGAPVSESSARVIKWPNPKHKIEIEEFKTIRQYANDKGIQLAGIRNGWIDLDAAKEAIDNASIILQKYDLSGKFGESIILDFSSPFESHVFSCVYDNVPNRIFFNSMAYGDKAALMKEYAKLVEEGWFVKGTDYRSLVYHEFGHLVAEAYDIDGLSIAQSLLGTSTEAETLQAVEKVLSQYAADAKDGSEIIAECFAAVYGGSENEFALKFVAECDKLI